MADLVYIDYGEIVPSFKENVILYYLKNTSVKCIHERSSEITGVQFMTYSRLSPII